MGVYQIETDGGSVYEIETAGGGASGSWSDEPQNQSSVFGNKIQSVANALNNPIGTASDYVKGNADKLVGMASRFIPFGDEVIGYGTAATDALMGQNFDTALNQRLKQVRGYQQSLDSENPIASTIASGTGALMMPIGSLTKEAKSVLGLLGRSAVEGGGYGALYGFGEGQGGVENRLNKAADAGTVGAIFSPITTLGLRGVSKIASKAPEVLEKLGVKQELQAYGGTRAAIDKAHDRMPDITFESGYENPLTPAIESFKKAGGGKTGMEGENLLMDLNAQKETYSNALDDLLTDAQKKQNFKIIPKFQYVEDYLKNVGATQKPQARAIAEDLVDKVANATKRGRIMDFQREKVALGNSIKNGAWGEDEFKNLRKDITKRLYGDLRRTVEDGYELFTGKSKNQIAKINKEIGYRENLEPIFKDLLTTDQARSPIKSIFNLLKTSGGLGQLLIAGSAGGAAGSPLGPLGMAAGAGAGLYAQTPSGQRDAATLLRGAANKLGWAPDVAPYVRDLPFSRLLGASQRNEEIGEPSMTPQQNALEEAKESSFSPSLETPLTDTQLEDADVSTPERKYKLDPVIEKAWIGQESNGNPNAVSKENAYMKANKTGTAKGLTQLLDSTGQEMFDKYKDMLPENASPSKYDPFNKVQNKILGKNYLEELLNKYDGDIELALTAYQSGPGTVDNLLRLTKGTTLRDILPFLGKDGRSYAKNIIGKSKNMVIDT